MIFYFLAFLAGAGLVGLIFWLLSQGLAIGIAGFLLILLVYLIFWLWTQRRQKQTEEQTRGQTERQAEGQIERARLMSEKESLVSENNKLQQSERELREHSATLMTQKGQLEKETEMLKVQLQEKTKEKEEALDRLQTEDQVHREKENQWTEESASLKAGNERLQKELQAQENRHQEKIKEKDEYFQEKIREKNEHFRDMEEKTRQLAEKAKIEFEHSAKKIIEENTKFHREKASENISFILKPFKENLEGFKKSLQGIGVKEESLDKTIKAFQDINTQMRDEAKELSFALKGDVKAQGQWGEFVLSNILEKSGLREGEEFFPQGKGLLEGIKDEEGASLRPDVVVKLPENKHIVIDAKVSLKNYQEWLSSTSEEDRKELLKKIRRSISSHIENLAAKQYPFSEGLNSPDFTLMFVPNEGVFSLIIRDDKAGFFEKAWQKSVILVGPTTLFAVLKTVASIWKMERQSQNAEEIARVGGLLYDKFVGFLKDMSKIDENLKKARDSYDSAYRKLKEGKGNIISKAHKLEKLGVRKKDNKPFPPSFRQINEEDNESEEKNPLSPSF